MTFSIIEIIPLIKLPFQTPDTFSYFTKSKIKPGTIVLVEFKKKKVLGYVFKVENLEKKRAFLKEKKLQLKPVLKIINSKPYFSDNQLKLAFWLKNYACLSLASSLSLFFPYKKIIELKKEQDKNNLPLTKNIFQIQTKQKLEQSDFTNQKTLIIVPQDNYLNFLKEEYQIKNIISSKISNKKFIEIFPKIVNKNKEVFLATKNSIFLPWQNLDQIIIYEEGSYFYKEFFKEPFFDYRKIFLKFAEINKIKYLAIDQLPSFSLIKNLNLKPQIKINIQRITNLEEFEEKIQNFEKTLIFVPQKSFAQKLICSKCFFVLNCQICNQPLTLSENQLYCHYCLKTYQIPSVCPNCQQETDFTAKNYGAEAIYNFLLKIKRNALYLDKDSQKIIKIFKNNNSADLVGSLLLLNPELSAEAFFFFNFSQFYFSNDSFLKERFIRILDFFNQKIENIFMVSEIINPQIEKLITNGEIINELLEERKKFNLPPYKRLIVLKEGGVNLQKIQKKLEKIKENLKFQVEVIGPIFAKPFKIKKRFFLELIIRIDDDLDFNLKKLLEEFEIETIDIDALSY